MLYNNDIWAPRSEKSLELCEHSVGQFLNAMIPLDPLLVWADSEGSD